MIIKQSQVIIEPSSAMPTTDTATALSGLSERFDDVRNRVAKAAQRSGRNAIDVKLIAISKTHPIEIIQQLINLGATELGENRVQEAENKIRTLGQQAHWHMVGHLQANKARKAVKLFDVIQSLDSVDLARRLNETCRQEQRASLPVLLQVDLGKEATKSGVDEADLLKLAAMVHDSTHLDLIGLMTLPPFFDEPNETRPYFSRLRLLRDKLAQDKLFGDREGELSMGMTHDFEIAIDEGATMIRVGTAIFGERGSRG